jgi:hypothetical protein
MENPFKKEGAAPQEGAKPAEKPAQEEQPENPLLAAAEDDAPDVDLGEDGDLDDAEVVEHDKGKHVSLKTFKRRLGKVVAQRNTAREETRTIAEQLAALKEDSKRLEGVSKILTDRYGGDVAKLQWDADFMDTAERLASNNQRVTITDVLEAMKKRPPPVKGGQQKVSEQKPQESQQETPERGKDPVLEGIVRRDAKRTIVDALSESDVDDRFVNMIATAALREIPVDKLAQLDGKAAIKFAAKYLKDNGINPADTLKGAKKTDGDTAENRRPPTSSGKGKGAGRQDAGDAGDDDAQTPKFKNHAEYTAARKKKLRGLAREMGLAA